MQILLRCDGGGSLGVGHVMRSLALAEAAVAAGHHVVVAGSFQGSFLQGQLAKAPVEVTQISPMTGGGLQPLLDLAGRLRPEVLHVDSYGPADGLREQLASAGIRAAGGSLVVSNMEDGPFGRRPAEVVVDPTLGAELAPRPPDETSWLLRGSRYTPVRQRVIDARRVPAPVARAARSVLVVMGGTDPVGLAPEAVRVLARTGCALEVTVIAVGENAEQARAVAQGSALRLSVLAPVDDLAAMMSAHDLVVSAAGTSVWELCCIGVPTAVVWAVDNQREGYQRVVEAGAAIGLGGPGLAGDEGAVDLLREALTDPQVRARLANAGRQVVDGLGAWRVVAMWEQALAMAGRSQPAIGTAGLVARPATLQDARQLWQWRNDPETRAGSRSSEQVPWDDHLRWFTDSLARTDRILLMVQDRLGPVGTVRWDLVEKGEWEVSITVAPQRRGQHLSRPLLRTAEVALLEHSQRTALPGHTSEVTASGATGVRAYLAVVSTDNHPSRRLFETSSYVPDLPPDLRGFMRFRKAARVA